MKNLGFIYNKDIFNNLKISLKGKKEENSNKTKYYFYEPLTKEVKEEQGNRKIKKTIITDFGKYNNEFLSQKINKKYDIGVKSSHLFKLQTTYPGLLSGSGYRHEVGGMNEEFQLGFFFDHTTGLPVIPASSIKGVLRYACEVNDGEYLKNIVKDKFSIENFDTKAFVQTVFEGKDNNKGVSIYQRDVFLDAFPIHSNGALFGSDYITPHKNPLKDPVPIKFLRVQPEVTYQFNFILKESNGLDADKKQKIFQQIILDLGLGAKTNVGYGQFVELSQEDRQSQYVKKYEPYTAVRNATKYKRNDEIEVKIIQVDKQYITMVDAEGSTFMKPLDNVIKKFEEATEKKRNRKNNPNLNYKPIAVGTWKIKFGADLDSNNLNFKIMPEIQ